MTSKVNENEVGLNISPNASLLEPSLRTASSPTLGQKKDVETSAERFWVLFLFGCCTMMNAFGWISISPLGSLIENVYGASPLVISLMANQFMLLYLPFNFPSVYIVDKYGLRAATLFGIGLTTCGYWLRCLINVNFYTCLFGQTLMAMGQPFLYNSPALVTTNWFPQKERSIATMVGTQMNVFGVLLGFLFPMFFVTSYNEGQVLSPAEKSNYESEIFTMLIVTAIMATVVFMLVIFTFRDRYGVPVWSSKQSHPQESEDEPQKPLLEQFKLCMRNKVYFFTALSTSLVMLIMFVFNNIIALLLIPEGITEASFANTLGIYMQAFGILGGVIFSLVLTCYPKRLNQSAYIIAIGEIASFGFFWYADTQASEPMLIVAISLMGFFLLPVIFVGYELAVEQTIKDNVGDTLSCGIINVATNFISGIVFFSINGLVNKETHKSNTITYSILVVNLVLALVFLIIGTLYEKKENKHN